MDPVHIQQAALSQIDPGERLLWSGTPRPASAAVSALPSTLFGIPFFTRQRRIGFTGIAEVRRVEKLIRDRLQATAA